MGKQKAVRKNSQKVKYKHVDVITKFDQCTLSIDSEMRINYVMCNYHKHGLTFENAMLFAIGFKLVQSSWVRNKTLQSFYLENMMIDYERGPYALFPKAEITTMFGHNYKEPVRFMLMPPFGTKKKQ